MGIVRAAVIARTFVAAPANRSLATERVAWKPDDGAPWLEGSGSRAV
jgi:hypothetical protein